MSRMLKNIGLFCKRELQKRPIFCLIVEYVCTLMLCVPMVVEYSCVHLYWSRSFECLMVEYLCVRGSIYSCHMFTSKQYDCSFVVGGVPLHTVRSTGLRYVVIGWLRLAGSLKL